MEIFTQKLLQNVVNHLDEISIEELQDALDNVDGKKPTQRLLAAIAYKNEVSQTELAGWYDVQRRTIYSWLKRLDTGKSLEQAVSDDKRTGRKRKLSKSQLKEFEEIVHEPPDEVGIDASAWTPALAQAFLEETYGIDYSVSSCRRLLKEAGLSHQKARRSAAEADETEQEAFHDELKKSGGSWTPPSSVSTKPRNPCKSNRMLTWFPRATRPSVELSGQRDWTCLLGAITEKRRNPERWEFQVHSPITGLPDLSGTGSPTISGSWTADHAKWPFPILNRVWHPVLFWPRGRRQASTVSGVSSDWLKQSARAYV